MDEFTTGEPVPEIKVLEALSNYFEDLSALQSAEQIADSDVALSGRFDVGARIKHHKEISEIKQKMTDLDSRLICTFISMFGVQLAGYEIAKMDKEI